LFGAGEQLRAIPLDPPRLRVQQAENGEMGQHGCPLVDPVTGARRVGIEQTLTRSRLTRIWPS